MSERKVLNKYIPPNFDPSKIPKNKIPRDKQYIVRLMTPFSMRCNTCGEYIYKGKKFNARKEDAKGEKYLSIQIYRFYIRCPMCAAEITFKTDPQSTDYICEKGATRNFEPWRDEANKTEKAKRKRAEEEENNPMKALENKTFDSKREIDILDALDDIRALNAAHQKVNQDALLEDLTSQLSKEEEEDIERRKMEEEEDDLIVRQFFPQKTLNGNRQSKNSLIMTTTPASSLSPSSTVPSLIVQEEAKNNFFSAMEESKNSPNSYRSSGPSNSLKTAVVKKTSMDLGIIRKPKLQPSNNSA